MSHNEDEHQKKLWQHLFFPPVLNFSLESLVAVLVLVVLNFAALQDSILHNYPKNLTFTAYSSEVWDTFLTALSRFSISGDIIVFVVWGIIGMLVYISVYRLIALVGGTSHSLEKGYRFVKREGSRGVARWFGTLYGLFTRLIVGFISIGLFVMTGFLIFSFAPHQFQLGLREILPYNILSLALCVGATILGIRLAVIGICLSVDRFARWYLA